MTNSDKFSDSVLVVGGGIAGIQAALDLADSNRHVIMVEKSPSIGGRMAMLDKTFPTNDCSMCIIAPKLIALNRHSNIDLLTNSEVLDVEGEAGDFKIRIRRKARYIDEETCIGCGVCAENCPVSLPSEFNQLLNDRQAAYIPFPQAVPLKFALDRRAPSPCKVACPANLSAQGYVALIAEGRYKEALEVVKDVMPFAGSIGRVCNHQCEFSCKRGDLEGSVSIRTLKRFIADWERGSGEEVKPTMLAEPNGRKVAVVGGGVAGLTCAYHLARLGYSPTVFEAQPVAGGMMRLGIPDYRLPADVLQAEIDDIVKMGVELRPGMRAGKDFQVRNLLENDGFEAVYIAIGLHNSIKLGIEGEDAKGVLHGVEFLRDAALGKPIPLGEKVVVIGGGNVAVDVVRTARRLGVKKIDMVCLEKRDEMPAHSWEIEEAEEEGIEVSNSWGPLRFITDNGKVTGIELKSCTSVFDPEGKFCPEYDESRRHFIDCDNVLVAIGQGADIEFLKGYIDCGRGINTDEDQSTNVPGIFAGGEIAYGPKMAIDAIASGRQAAWNIDKYLNNGVNTTEPPLIEIVDIDKSEYYKPEQVETVQRHCSDIIPPDKRSDNFNEIELPLTEEEARAEAARCLSCGVCARCGVCEIVCEPKAVRYRDTEKIVEYNVSSVVVAPGYECFDPSTMDEYGYNRYPDVITALEFERILSASGPFAGHISRLSDGKDPKKLAFIQCVGSRDRNNGNPYCSSVCCMFTIKEAVIAKEHAPGLDITVYYMDIRAHGKEFDYYYKRAVEEVGINFIRSRVSSVDRVEREGEPGKLKLNFVGEDDEIRSDDFDMVVLSTGLVPNKDAVEFAKRIDIELNSYNFCDTRSLAPLSTSREGVYVCGAFSEPKDIPETIAQASGAAGTAMLYSVPRKLEEEGEGEGAAEEKVSPGVMEPGAEVRTGVIVCNCGINIGKVVNVPEVAEYAKGLAGVAVSEDALYSCSQDTQEKIKKLILDNNLNRIVVASCTPRTHEPLFQETLKEVGLNPYLFELVNIREHCSWVHSREPEEATEKAKDLVRKAVGRAATLEPLTKVKLDIIKGGLVIGGGPAGMTVASALANLGYRVHLLEKTVELGGNLRDIRILPTGEDPREFLNNLKKEVESNKNISIYYNTTINDISGHIGHFTTSFEHKPDGGGETLAEEIHDGAIIVATGGVEYKPTEFHYSESDNVLLQREFEARIVKDEIKARSVAMIQCVGSRSEEFGWCSRVCCTEAVKNALAYKKKIPDADVAILYKDIRTYGFKEDYYEEAAAAGVRFIRYDDEAPPRLEIGDGGKLRLFVNDKLIGGELELNPELCILSAGIHPNSGNSELSEMLKVPISRDGFFLEAHMKLRPVDFYTEGVFLCGLAHSPKTLSESLGQAYAAVARANTILAKDHLELGGIVASVESEKCSVCLTCVRVCPYQIPVINDKNVADIEVAKCQGCGICVAECPAKAIQLAHFKDHQVKAETDALLCVEEGEK